jgi:hypothetical protein
VTGADHDGDSGLQEVGMIRPSSPWRQRRGSSKTRRAGKHRHQGIWQGDGAGGPANFSGSYKILQSGSRLKLMQAESIHESGNVTHAQARIKLCPTRQGDAAGPSERLPGRSTDLVSKLRSCELHFHLR